MGRGNRTYIKLNVRNSTSPLRLDHAFLTVERHKREWESSSMAKKIKGVVAPPPSSPCRTMVIPVVVTHNYPHILRVGTCGTVNEITGMNDVKCRYSEHLARANVPCWINLATTVGDTDDVRDWCVLEGRHTSLQACGIRRWRSHFHT